MRAIGICPAKKIVCLVVDECHRARGHNDVVMAVKKMQEQNCLFRVLGLSATPGSSNEAIQVDHNLGGSLHEQLTKAACEVV